MRITVKRGETVLFSTTEDITPEEYCRQCTSAKPPENSVTGSVYKSWIKLDLWTYELIPWPKCSVQKTLVFFREN